MRRRYDSPAAADLQLRKVLTARASFADVMISHAVYIPAHSHQ